MSRYLGTNFSWVYRITIHATSKVFGIKVDHLTWKINLLYIVNSNNIIMLA